MDQASAPQNYPEMQPPANTPPVSPVPPVTISPSAAPTSSKKWLKIGAVTLILLGISLLGAYAYQNYYQDKPSTSSSVPTLVSSSSAKKDDKADWIKVTSVANNFSLKYPPTWQVDPSYKDISDPKNGWHDPFLNNFNSVKGAEKGYELTAQQAKLVYKVEKNSSTSLDQQVSVIRQELSNPTQENLTIGSDKAVLLTGDVPAAGPDPASRKAYLLAVHGGTLYTFTASNLNLTVIKDILSTVTFTNPQ